jgi:hypothetical protein
LCPSPTTTGRRGVIETPNPLWSTLRLLWTKKPNSRASSPTRRHTMSTGCTKSLEDRLNQGRSQGTWHAEGPYLSCSSVNMVSNMNRIYGVNPPKRQRDQRCLARDRLQSAFIQKVEPPEAQTWSFPSPCLSRSWRSQGENSGYRNSALTRPLEPLAASFVHPPRTSLSTSL